MSSPKFLNKKIVLLIGCGNIGLRYLQGILKVNFSLKLYLIDVNKEALNKVKSALLNQEKKIIKNHQINISNSLENVKESEIDLVIITTTADKRVEIIEKISSKFCVNFWLLEKLLAQSTEQLKIISEKIFNKNFCWVNTPRRSMEWYQKIKKIFRDHTPFPFKFEISGGQWGLACNSIHFIDLISWLIDSEIHDLNVLNKNKWEESKRKNFKELFGRIKVSFKNGSELEIICDKSNNPIEISAQTESGVWKISEQNGIAFGPTGQTIKGSIEYQSLITSPIVEDIFRNNICTLTPLNESIKLHNHLLKGLLENYNKTNNCSSLILPIT